MLKDNQDLLAALVERSLALVAEVQRLEDQISKHFADRAISGVDYTRNVPERPRPVPGITAASGAQRRR